MQRYLWNFSAFAQIGKLDKAKPDYADAYTWAMPLKAKGIEEAIEAYNKVLSIKPDYAEAYYNMGNALKVELDEAIDGYKKALYPAFFAQYAELEEEGMLMLFKDVAAKPWNYFGRLDPELLRPITMCNKAQGKIVENIALTDIKNQ